MTDTARTTEPATAATSTHRVMASAATALRIFTGLVWLSNGLARLFDVGNYDWGLFSST